MEEEEKKPQGAFYSRGTRPSLPPWVEEGSKTPQKGWSQHLLTLSRSHFAYEMAPLFSGSLRGKVTGEER